VRRLACSASERSLHFRALVSVRVALLHVGARLNVLALIATRNPNSALPAMQGDTRVRAAGGGHANQRADGDQVHPARSEDADEERPQVCACVGCCLCWVYVGLLGEVLQCALSTESATTLGGDLSLLGCTGPSVGYRSYKSAPGGFKCTSSF